MQPQQPQPNYDFIMNPGAAPKRPSFGGGSLAMRLLVIVGGIFLVVVVLGIGIKLLTGSGGSFNKAAMLSVAQDQTEIIRLSTLGVQDSVSQSSKNFSITAQLGVTSQQETLLTYLSSHGYKASPKVLILKQNSNIDTQLASAQSSSTFDIVFKGVMEQELTTYKNDLSAAYKGASPSAQAVLSKQYDAAQLLSTQLGGDTTQ